MIATAAPAKKLAIFGGPKTVTADYPDLFKWPIVTTEDEQAVLEVLRAGRMSHTDITEHFEREWGAYQGTQYNLGHCNGTTALLSAMYGIGLGSGDEMICPSITYWASALPARLLGAIPVLADVHPETHNLDPASIEQHITPRTRAIMVVHYCGYPCDMDPILAIARRHKLRVIEDVSHAHGSLYKGRKCGALADVAAMSMMSMKSFAIGEAGMLCTNDAMIYQRAVAFCHYERIGTLVKDPALRATVVSHDAVQAAFPAGGLKGRMNQTCAAMGRVQLKYYPDRIKAIQAAINRFWDLLEGVPGLRAHRPPAGQGSTMGGWYNPVGRYIPEELGGLPVEKFIDAVNAEGGRTGRGCNYPLHMHPQLAASRKLSGSLPVSENLYARSFGIPYFKHDEAKIIEQFAAAYRKVAENADQLR